VFLDPGSARLKPLVRDDGVLFFAEVQALENRNIIIGRALRSREAASRRMLQEAPVQAGISFETRLSALLRMRAGGYQAGFS
jgi:hypothetical protein